MSEKNDIFFSPKVQRNKRSRSSPETAADFKRKEKYKMGNGEEKVGSTSLSQLMDCFSVLWIKSWHIRLLNRMWRFWQLPWNSCLQKM